MARQNNVFCMINTKEGDDPLEPSEHAERAERAERVSRGAVRDDEDAATVIAILTALAAAATEPDEEPAPARSVWADPAHRLGLRALAPTGWWASGLPR